jgi:Ca2+/Na+ antiporter
MSKFPPFIFGFGAGVIISALAGFVHADRIQVNGTAIQYGLILALAIVVMSLVWLNRQFQTRFAGLGFLLAWVLVTLRLAVETSGGDLVFMVAWYSTTYIIVGAILLATAATMPILRVRSGSKRHAIHNESPAISIPETLAD